MLMMVMVTLKEIMMMLMMLLKDLEFSKSR